MEKTITIDGRDVTFKSTGGVPLRYKAQFARDYLADLAKMRKYVGIDVETVDLESLDFGMFYNIAWVLAKTADKTIPEPLTWLDGFDSFPIIEIIPELQELLAASIQTIKKK